MHGWALRTTTAAAGRNRTAATAGRGASGDRATANRGSAADRGSAGDRAATGYRAATHGADADGRRYAGSHLRTIS